MNLVMPPFYAGAFENIDRSTRKISGVAVTATNSTHDILVEPMGVEFKLPIPLLVGHDHNHCVGVVTEAEATELGLRFTARISDIEEPGLARDQCDQAWQEVWSGLRSAVSIGWSSIEKVPTKSKGWHVKKWRWLELSLVTVGAEANALLDPVQPLDTTPPQRTGGKVFLTPEDIRAGERSAWRT